jgi:hypothetical protein
MTLKRVKAHLVDIDWPVKAEKNPCCEITLRNVNTAVLVEPKQITKLRLQGFSVYDYTEALDMDEEWVDQESCCYPQGRIKNEEIT